MAEHQTTPSGVESKRVWLRKVAEEARQRALQWQDIAEMAGEWERQSHHNISQIDEAIRLVECGLAFLSEMEKRND